MSKNGHASPVIIIFGITGDLSKRKLLPALYNMLNEHLLPEDTKIIGTSRRAIEKDSFIKTIESWILDKNQVCDPKTLDKVKNSLETIQLDPKDTKSYGKLKKLISSFDPDNHRVHMFYMSVPSTAYEPIIAGLSASQLNGENSRLLLEKPFGYNLESAKQLITLVNKSFSENQIYRIDHYLAKETAQNLLAFRLHNPIFAPLWNCQHIEKVHIEAFETIGIEGRANFYEQTGALRDFIQSHLMQLLSITMMDIPENMTSEAIHRSKQRFFSALKSADPKEAVRGQYESYRQEVSNPRSSVETYAQLTLRSTSESWRDTEMILETGKAMSEKTTKITIEFKSEHERRRNNLTFQIQPNEGISLDLVVKEPGLENNMQHTSLEFRYDKTFKNYRYVDAYERVLMDALSGDQSLFASDNEVIETWRVLQPVLDYWQASPDKLHFYTVGSKALNLT